MNEERPEPVICFGQQPNGFFPKRFLFAKIETARKLQSAIGGKIVFFYHDSDADYRETITLLTDINTGEEVRINFTHDNRIQKKYSPLYVKKISASWKGETKRRLPRFLAKSNIDIFENATGDTAADFCLDMYIRLGIFEGIEIVRSSDKNFRMTASDLAEFFADVNYEGEIVRAEMHQGNLRLHEGGGKYFDVASPEVIEKWQKSAGRDYRFAWMQSVIHCTHYISGIGENEYLKKENFPEVAFITREEIERSDHAYIPK